jgi:hypothetical protein
MKSSLNYFAQNLRAGAASLGPLRLEQLHQFRPIVPDVADIVADLPRLHMLRVIRSEQIDRQSGRVVCY